MKQLVLYRLDCGRMGEIVSLFVTTDAELKAAYGKDVYFGEVLGKHSDIGAGLSPDDITVVSEDQAFIAQYQEVMKANESVGYNPLSYINER